MPQTNTSHARTRRDLKSASLSSRPISERRRRATRAQFAKSVRNRHGARVELATNARPLQEQTIGRRATPASQRETRTTVIPSAGEHPQVLARSAEPSLGETESPATATMLPPVHVTHDRKQHFASDEPETPTSTVEPESKPGGPSTPPLARLNTGVAHPEDYDDEGPLTPAEQPRTYVPQTTGTANSVPVPGLPSAAGASIGSPLVLTAPRTSVSAVPAPGPNDRTPQPAPEVKAKLPSVEDEVVQTQFVPSLFNRDGQLIVPPALKGSREILVHQNVEADREGLTRIKDDADLLRLRARRELVALPEVPGLDIDDRLPGNRRYTRPWTARFLEELARAHSARFHTALILTSAVRTVEVQERLLRTNGNAAPVEGETASPHLTGQAVDLGKKGLSLTEIAWMRGYLLPLVQQGKIDVEEEFQQSCFHVSVYRSYLPQGAPARQIPARSTPATALAAAIR